MKRITKIFSLLLSVILVLSMTFTAFGDVAGEKGKLSDLKNKKQQGYLIFICSASIEGYLRFCKLPVDGILGTNTEIKNGKYTR